MPGEIPHSPGEIPHSPEISEPLDILVDGMDNPVQLEREYKNRNPLELME